MYSTTRIVFTGPRQAAIEEVPLSEPGKGQVLIRSLRSLISTGTELTAYSGDFPPNSVWARYVRYPWVPGYSNVGEVVACGPEVDSVHEGERVVSYGSHASLILQDAHMVQPIPEGVSDDESPFMVLSTIALGGVRLAQIAFGEAIVVMGAGLVGQLATQYSRLSGGWPVIAVDLAESRLATAHKHGATHTLVGGRPELVDDIAALTKGRLADVAIEATGSPRVIPSLFRCVRRRGRVILLGSPRGKTEVDFHDEVHTLGLQVIGAHNSVHPVHETPFNVWTQPRDGELFLDLLAAQQIAVSDLISHRYPWHEAPAAYDMLLSDRTQAMGVLLDWQC
jgi:2-desacetyl-2-hydroxyethyl bacteriochlorophyllide A dehydrogenase